MSATVAVSLLLSCVVWAFPDLARSVEGIEGDLRLGFERALAGARARSDAVAGEGVL